MDASANTGTGTRRQHAIALRLEGRSYRQIEKEIGVAGSTLSLWLRDIPLTDEQKAALSPNGPIVLGTRAATNRANWARRRARIREQARDDVNALTEGELFVAGVIAYWAEGAKAKPWRTSEQVTFTNSDPDMIRLFLRWLRLIGVDDSRLILRVLIHESADEAEAVRFWSTVAGLAPGRFSKTTLKRHTRVPHATSPSNHPAICRLRLVLLRTRRARHPW